ncbi:MAG: hypothetical protein JNM59_07190 [Hyphomonadaceae bacterium]|nr:hypothetical protein [Hyphomonadaceae bacterium]
MDRRKLILSGAAGAGLGVAAYGAIVAAGAVPACPTEDPLAQPADAALLRIGARYLATAAGAAEKQRLSALAECLLAHGPVTLNAATASLSAAAPEDFAKGEVVLCDGWVLARNEARACALLTLASQTA